ISSQAAADPGRDCWPALTLTGTSPTLPPQQYSDNQADVGGELSLTRCSRTRCGTQHKQATPRQRLQITAHEGPQPTAHPVPTHRGAHLLTHYKPNGGGPGIVPPDEQVARPQRPASPAAGPSRAREIRAPPHPGSCRQHDNTRLSDSEADALASLPAPRRQD